MQQKIFEIESNRALNANVYEMKLRGDASDCRPGQFAQLLLPSFYLRRPISVCDADGEGLTLVYKSVGRGTEAMSAYPAGMKLDVLTGLGNGYDLAKTGDAPLLIGGGAGVPPMYMAAKKLIEAGRDVQVILGFNAAAEIFYEDKFRQLGAQVTIATADGSCGVKGFVTDAMQGMRYSHCLVCGPEPMLRAVYNASETGGQFSFEERMGCGFGACMGCSCKTKYGNKRICKDGPVLMKEEIIW